MSLALPSFVIQAQAEGATLVNYQPLKKPNPDEGWRPLSPEEMSKRTLQLTFKAAELSAEAADSLHMSYVSDRVFDIIDTAHRVIDERERFRNKFHMRLEVRGDQAILVYKNRY